jgi:hypothetical protein
MAGRALIGLCGSFVFIIVVSFLFSWSSLSPTEVALKYNYVRQYVEDEAATEPGLYFLGPFTKFIRYPTIVHITKLGEVHGRTMEGLPLELNVDFQWKYLPGKVRELYSNFDVDYRTVFRTKATEIITMTGSVHSAYEIFNSRAVVAEAMRSAMDTYFQANLYSTVPSLQIQGDWLPDAFSDQITKAQIQKNNISAMQNRYNQMEVRFETRVIVAEQQANVTMTVASGSAEALLKYAHADSQVINYSTSAEMESYKKVKEKVNLKSNELVDYMWYDFLAGGGFGATGNLTDTTVLVGIEPSTYIDR